MVNNLVGFIKLGIVERYNESLEKKVYFNSIIYSFFN
jgi:hypothetical protein